MNNWNLVEILKQFSPKQKLFVLIFMVIVIGGTTIVTTYFTTACNDLEEATIRLKEDNLTLREDVDKLKDREMVLSSRVMEIALQATQLKSALIEEEEQSRLASQEVGAPAPERIVMMDQMIEPDEAITETSISVDTLNGVVHMTKTEILEKTRIVEAPPQLVYVPQTKDNSKAINILDDIIQKSKEVINDNN